MLFSIQNYSFAANYTIFITKKMTLWQNRTQKAAVCDKNAAKWLLGLRL